MKQIFSLFIIPYYFIYYTLLGVLLELYFTWISGLNKFLAVIMLFISFFGVLLSHLGISKLYKIPYIICPFKKFNFITFGIATVYFLVMINISIWRVEENTSRGLFFTVITFIVAIVNFVGLGFQFEGKE